MEPSTSMCPVLVSLPGLLAAPTLHYTSSLFFLILILVKVIILTTDALEQQHRHQIARSSLNQSVPHLTVDVRCVFDVEWKCSRGPLPFVVLQVHGSTVPLVLNFSCTCSAYFSKLPFVHKLLTVNAIGSFPNMNSHPMASVCRMTLSWANALVNKSAPLSLPLTLWYCNLRDASSHWTHNSSSGVFLPFLNPCVG